MHCGKKQKLNNKYGAGSTMRKGLVVIALAGGLLTGFHCEVSVAGSAYDGNELLRQCQQYIRAADDEKNYDRIDAGMCGGFIQGVDSTFAMLGDNLKKMQDSACLRE